MPLHEYQCAKCGRFEVIQKFSDGPLTACPQCGKPVERLLSAPAIQFKGSGWYVTDYGRKSSGGEGKGESNSKDGSKDSSPKESKDSSSKESKDSSSKETASAAPTSTPKDGSSGRH